VSERDDKKKSLERASGIVKGVVAGAAGAVSAALGAPVAMGVGMGVVTSWAHDFARDLIHGRRQKRVDDLFRQLLTGEGAMTEEQCKEALEKEPLCSEVLIRLLEDDEDEKAWAYAALFRSFADDLIPKGDRLRFLRCARELTNAELLGMRSWQQWSKPQVKGPFVLFKISFGTQYREWFIQPELIQEENPHVIEVLCRWGFIMRVHDRGKQEKLPGPPNIPDLRTDEYPVPGKSRLNVEPILAMLLFVFANRGHGRDLDLRAPKTLSVHVEGRVDAIDYRSDRVIHLDPTDGQPSTFTSTQTSPKPAVDDSKLRIEKQVTILANRLEGLPKDSPEAVKELRNIGNEMKYIRTTGLSFADLAEAGKKAGPTGGTVTVAGKPVTVAPTVTINSPRRK
jgi:hypothetical protein